MLGSKVPDNDANGFSLQIKAPKFYMKLEAKSGKITYVLLYLLIDLLYTNFLFVSTF